MDRQGMMGQASTRLWEPAWTGVHPSVRLIGSAWQSG